MPIEVYPSTPAPSFVLPFDDEYETLVGGHFGGQNEQRFSLTRFPTRKFGLAYKTLAFASEEYLISQFFKKMRGGLTAFWFVLPKSRFLYDEYVGRGDGTTDVFDLHSKSTVVDAALKVYVDGVEKTRPTHYDVLTGGGEAGVDRIDFTPGNIPAAGALITHEGWGQLRIKALMGDKLSGRWFSPEYTEFDVITLREEHW